jgi:hypothetical protein
MIEATMRKAGSSAAATDAAKKALAEASAPGAIDVTSVPSLEAALGIGNDAAPAGAVVPAGSRAVAPRAAAIGGGGIQGFSTDDIKFPVLKIVNGSGPLSQKYPGGTVILADQEFMPPPPLDITKPNLVFPRFNFVPVELRKRFRENLDDAAYKAGQQPRVVDTAEEVEALGGTYIWQGRIKPTWSPTATCFLLIEKPQGVDNPIFAQEINGKFYAPAVFYAGGSAFTDFAKTIISTAQLSLQVVVSAEGEPLRKEPLVYKKVWKWETKKLVKGNNSVFCPVVNVTNEETTPELRELCRGLKGSAAEAEGGE